MPRKAEACSGPAHLIETIVSPTFSSLSSESMRLPNAMPVVGAPHSSTARLNAQHLIVVGLVFLSLIGCARTDYRREADRQAYCLIQSRQTDARWDVPNRAVEPKHHSRMYMAAENDCGPKPIDDDAASCYMQHPNCIDNTCYYSKIPSKVHTENPVWVDYLPRDENNQIKLTQELAIDLSLLHSRDYQTEFEAVYLTALDLTGNRFEFDTQWFGGLGALFTANGDDIAPTESGSVSLGPLGLSRNLAGGGQFATSVLNSLSWDFAGGFQAGSAALVTTFTQPLLRGAFRHVRLESLTQAERQLLYSVRGFARFRRDFYVDVVSSYLNLLTRVQALRNLRTNVANLRKNLVEHEFYVQLEMVSQIQRDQVFQEYQRGRSSLLGAEQDLAAALDGFKFQLGLPSWVPMQIDESLLEPFELVDPQLVQLQAEAQELYETLVQYLPPDKAPKKLLLEKFEEFKKLRERTAEFVPSIDDEMDQWRKRLDATDRDQLSTDDRLDVQQQSDLEVQIRTRFDELKTSLEDRESYHEKVIQEIERYDSSSSKDSGDAGEDDPSSESPSSDSPTSDSTEPEIQAWKSLMEAVGETLREEIAELYISQTQVRLFLIDIEPQEIDQYTAVSYAHVNRLDLMNDKARVMDAFRRVEVAADGLESDLSITGNAIVGSDAGRNNAFRFDSSANRYSVGVEFDGPLNRLVERNVYRDAQIAYQQTSREFMAQKDIVANDVRSVLRRLELARLNFQIARQQLVAATRQVDQAQIDLRRSSEADSNLTLFLLEALEGVLDARNSLIGNWIEYRIQKMRLFTLLELLYLDENGKWINEDTGLEELKQFPYIDEEYFPPQWVDPSAERTDSREVDKLEDDIESDSVPNQSPTKTEDESPSPLLDGPAVEPAVDEGISV